MMFILFDQGVAAAFSFACEAAVASISMASIFDSGFFVHTLK
jgi:hypothetical protein